MYPRMRMRLGDFTVPPGTEGLMHVTYQPVPRPIVVRGSLNPWADAQTTQLRNQEDVA